MTQAASSLPMRSRYTAAALHTEARELHTPRIVWINVGWLCVIAALALSMLGIVAIGTAERAPNQPNFEMRQVMHLCIGLLAAGIFALPHYRWLERFSLPFMVIAVGLLVFVLIPFVPEAIVRPRGGARRWIDLGPTDFQPSEIAKIAYILLLANYLRVKQNYRTLPGVVLPMGLTLIPMGLVLIEPNLGMALLFVPTLFAMLVAAGAKIRHLLLIIVLGLSLAPLSYPVLRPHQKDRVDALIAQISGDTRYERDIGYQGAKAMTLVGAGGIFGAGQGKAADLIEFNHLPEKHNDMVFAVICCRWGMLGGMAVIGAIGMFCVGGLLTAGMCKDPFGRLVAVGIIASLFAQTAINTGMTVGLLPITGLPLPFVSYGGSSMVATWMMVGLLFNIAMRPPRHFARKSFEFDESRKED